MATNAQGPGFHIVSPGKPALIGIWVGGCPQTVNECQAVPSEEWRAGPWGRACIQSNFSQLPSATTSFPRDTFYFPAAWKSKPMLLSSAFRNSLMSSSLPTLTTLPSSLPSHHHIVLLSILSLLLTHVFWLRIPSSVRQTKLPLGKQNKTKLFSFSRTTGECGLILDPWQQSHTFRSSLFIQALLLVRCHICNPLGVLSYLVS